MNQMNQNQEQPVPAPPQQRQMVSVAMPRATPYVTYGLIAFTVVIFLLQMLSRTTGTDKLAEYGALIRADILAGELWRFITPVLLHWNPLHILFNMYALYALGTGLERNFGHGRFFVLYVVAGFTGNVVSFLFSTGISASAGASTAIFGLLGAEAIFLFMNRKLFAGHYGRAIQNVIFIAVVNLIFGLQPGIDNWGHVGGLLGGMLFTFLAGPVWKIEGVPPALHVVDQRSMRDVIVGAATVILVFSAVAMWGIIKS
jgi:rhomboid protease GluP